MSFRIVGGYGLYIRLENAIPLNPVECLEKFFYAEKFDIRNVWNNQKSDVHPPLYYLIFHIFGLIIHHYGGVKSGILLNFIFHTCNIVLVYILLKKILCSIDVSLIGCGLYALMPPVLGNVIFIRMYTLFSLFVLLLVLCMVYGMQERQDGKFYFMLCIAGIGGILTHYYFVVFLFYSCFVYGIRQLLLKMWRQFFGFIGAMSVISGVSCMIFPAMLTHVFRGYRGEQSFDNLIHSSWMDMLQFYVPSLDSVCGGLFLMGVLISCALLLKNSTLSMLNKIRYHNVFLILLCPCILYFLTITKIAVLKSERYISPIFSLCVILLVWGIRNIVSLISTNERAAVIITICIVCFAVVNSWKSYTWPELHLEQEQYMNIAKQYGQDNACIDIYAASWKSISALQEFAQYQAVSFIPMNELELLDSEYIKEYEHLVVYIDSEADKEQTSNILDLFIEKGPMLEQYTLLYQFGYHAVYYLE